SIGRPGENPPEQIEKRVAILAVERADIARGGFDPAQDDRRVALERGAGAAASLSEHWLPRRGEPLGGKRRRAMFINETARRGFVGGRQRAHPFRDVVVDQRLELRRLV